MSNTKIRVEVQDFHVPDHVRPVSEVGRRQDGFNIPPLIQLGALDDDALSSLCDQFRVDVFAKARRQRETGET
jgi:hypothetical protein